MPGDLLLLLFIVTLCALSLCAGVGNKEGQGKGKRRNIDDELGAHFDSLKDSNKRKRINDRLHMTRNRAAGNKHRQDNDEVSDVAWKANDKTEQGVNADIDLYEGDIVLTDETQFDHVDSAIDEQTNLRRKRKVLSTTIFGNNVRWVDTIYYEYDSKTIPTSAAAVRSAIDQAIAFWQNNTCLIFSQSSTAKDRIRFFKGSGCYSSIGRTGGVQGISIGDGCQYLGIVAHEIGHALGLFHEQSRSDRNNFVRILTANIQADMLSNFQSYSPNYMNTYGTTYDFGSVMHYGPTAFAISPSQQTIQTIDSNYQYTMGQRDSPSFTDIKAINLAYNCQAKCSTAVTCSNGGYLNFRNCTQCVCPTGFSGATCTTVSTSSANCGGHLQATTQWKTLNLNRSNNVKQNCNWLIEAVGETKIEIQFSSSPFPNTCTSPCSTDYVEVKSGNDFQSAGPRHEQDDCDESCDKTSWVFCQISSNGLIPYSVSFWVLFSQTVIMVQLLLFLLLLCSVHTYADLNNNTKISNATASMCEKSYDPLITFSCQILGLTSWSLEEKSVFASMYVTELKRRLLSQYVFQGILGCVVGIVAVVDHSIGLIPLFSSELLHQPIFNFHRAIMVHEIFGGVLRILRAVGAHYYYLNPETYATSLFLNWCRQVTLHVAYIFENPLITMIFALTVIRLLAVVTPKRLKFLHHQRMFWCIYAFSLALRWPVPIETVWQLQLNTTASGIVYLTVRSLPPPLQYFATNVMSWYEIVEAGFLTICTLAVVIALVRYNGKNKVIVQPHVLKVRKEAKQSDQIVMATVLTLVNAIPYAINIVINEVVYYFIISVGYAFPAVPSQQITVREAIDVTIKSVNLAIMCDFLLFSMRPIMALNFTLFLALSPQFRKATFATFKRVAVKLNLRTDSGLVVSLKNPTSMSETTKPGRTITFITTKNL